MNEKPSSDQIRKVTAQEYLKAQSHANGNGIRGFFKSNLFGALVLLSIGWGTTVVGMYWRLSAMDEWKGRFEAKVDHMDSQGTNFSHYQIAELQKDNARYEVRLDKLEQKTERMPV